MADDTPLARRRQGRVRRRSGSSWRSSPSPSSSGRSCATGTRSATRSSRRRPGWLRRSAFGAGGGGDDRHRAAVAARPPPARRRPAARARSSPATSWARSASTCPAGCGRSSAAASWPAAHGVRPRGGLRLGGAVARRALPRRPCSWSVAGLPALLAGDDGTGPVAVRRCCCPSGWSCLHPRVLGAARAPRRAAHPAARRPRASRRGASRSTLVGLLRAGLARHRRRHLGRGPRARPRRRPRSRSARPRCCRGSSASCSCRCPAASGCGRRPSSPPPGRSTRGSRRPPRWRPGCSSSLVDAVGRRCSARSALRRGRRGDAQPEWTVDDE